MDKKLTTAQRTYQKRYGLLFGGIFAAIIGSIWGIWVGQYFGNFSLEMTVISVLVLVGLISLSLKARHDRPLGKGSLPYLHSGVFWAKFYGVIFAEVVVIFFIINWVNANHLANAIIPVIAFIVAAHFAPLGKINGISLWYWTSAFVCLTIGATLIAVPSMASITIGGATTDIWSFVSVSVFTLGLWLTSLGCSVIYRRTRK